MITLRDEAVKLTKNQYDWCIENFDTMEAKELLFKGHIRFAYKMASNFYGGKRFPAEEIEGMALIGLWTAITKFDPSKGFKLTTFAARIINNEICKHLRKYKNIPEDISLNDSKSDTTEDRGTELLYAIVDNKDHIGIHETQCMVQECLNILPDKERIIFELYYNKDLNQVAISEIMKCSQVQVARLLKRGRERMLIKIATGKTITGNVCEADVSRAKMMIRKELGIEIN